MSHLRISGLHKRLLMWACIGYVGIVGLYGTSRIIARKGRVTATIVHPHGEGFGQQYVSYANSITLIRPFEPFSMRDFLTASCLFLTGLATGLFFIVAGQIPRRTPHRSLFLLFSAGFIYLGFDELFMFHEFIGLNLAQLLHPEARGLDILRYDLNGHIIVLYALAGLGIMLWHRRFFLANRLGFALLAAGLALQGLAAVVDLFWNRLGPLQRLLGPLGFLVFRDEFFEMTAAFLYLCAFVIYGIGYLSHYYRFENGNALLAPMVVGEDDERPVASSSKSDTSSTFPQSVFSWGFRNEKRSREPRNHMPQAHRR